MAPRARHSNGGHDNGEHDKGGPGQWLPAVF